MINPADLVDRPKLNKFTGSFYTGEECNELLSVAQGTYFELPVIFAGFYGIRRSEALGLRWSAFDFEHDTFTINHTRIECIIGGNNYPPAYWVRA